MSGKGERVCYKTDDIQIFLNLAFLFGTRNISCLRGGLILNVHIYLCNQREFLFVQNKNQTRGYCLICSKKVISIVVLVAVKSLNKKQNSRQPVIG